MIEVVTFKKNGKFSFFEVYFMEDISASSECMRHQVSLCGKYGVFRTFPYTPAFFHLELK